MRRVIVYHDNCHDGITALAGALERWPDAEPYAGKHDEPPDLERLRGARVVFVDFCWKYPIMREVARVAEGVLVLDHHKTALADMAGAGPVDRIGKPGTFFPERAWPGTLPQWWEQNVAQDLLENADIEGAIIYCIFDMNRSGAGLAWDYLVGGIRPKLVDYVEDRDLWRFRLPNCREVHAACSSFELTLSARRLLLSLDVDQLAKEGKGILRYHDKLIESAAKHARRSTIAGHDVPTMACPTIEIVSDLAGKLAQGEPFAAVYIDRADGSRVYSLRSSKDGLDVEEIAVSMGGGGHKHASGFVIKPDRIPQALGSRSTR